MYNTADNLFLMMHSEHEKLNSHFSAKSLKYFEKINNQIEKSSPRRKRLLKSSIKQKKDNNNQDKSIVFYS